MPHYAALEADGRITNDEIVLLPWSMTKTGRRKQMWSGLTFGHWL